MHIYCTTVPAVFKLTEAMATNERSEQYIQVDIRMIKYGMVYLGSLTKLFSITVEIVK